MTDEEINELESLIEEEQRYKARSNFTEFMKLTLPDLDLTQFHRKFYEILHLFAIGKIRKLIISCPPQHGKLIDDDEMVLTNKGMVRHGDLKIGDYVFNPSGKQINVIDIIDQTEPCDVEITFTNGEKIKCHRNHLWTVESKRGKTRTVETNVFFKEDLFNGESGKRGCRYKNYLPRHDFVKQYDCKHVKIDPYTLGIWLGDGRASAPLMTLGKNDFDYISKYIKGDIGTITENKTTKDISLINSLEYFRGYNLLNNKHIPSDYLVNSKSNRLELLAGLIDSDGYLHDKSGQYTFSNINKVLVDDVCVLLSSLGISYSVTVIEPRKEPNSFGIQDMNVCYQVRFTQNSDFIPCKLDRKKTTITKKHRRVSLKSVRWLKEEEKASGKCITVNSNDGLYLVGKRMIPTHNSEGSTRKLPNFIHGLNKDAKIGVLSYASTFAQKFNRDIKRTMTTDSYKLAFLETRINERALVTSQGWKNTQEEFEVIDSKGSLKAVGVGGSLTGETIDILIMDDLYKDYKDATSPVVSEGVWEWFITVAQTRLHNDSQELMTFTRWDENDAIGRLEKLGEVINAVDYNSIEEAIEAAGRTKYIKINFEAIKSGKPNWLDNREEGEALYPKRHGLEKLESLRKKDPPKFNSLYQGQPRNKEGLLYDEFGEYESLPELKTIKSYTDTADKGDDYLCSIIYGVPVDSSLERLYVLDVLYTQKPMEFTEPATAEMIIKNDSRVNNVESNNGGRGFARSVDTLLKSHGNRYTLEWFTQSQNKESRIVTNAASVNRTLLFPVGWKSRWGDFYLSLSNYKRLFKANKHDDSADTITGVYETEFCKAKAPTIIW